MELVQYNNDFFYTYQRNGNDRNGNTIYAFTIFKKYYPCDNGIEYIYTNYNFTVANELKKTLTKSNEIRIKSYSSTIKSDIENIIKRL